MPKENAHKEEDILSSSEEEPDRSEDLTSSADDDDFQEVPETADEETSDEEDDAAWGMTREPEPPKAPKKPNAEAKQPPRKGRKLEFGSPKSKPAKVKADTTKPKTEPEPKAKKMENPSLREVKSNRHHRQASKRNRTLFRKPHKRNQNQKDRNLL